MALDANLLRTNAALAGLTDEQVTAITTLSVNDEDRVIADRIGRLYGEFDRDILETAGIEKKQGEKTYDYMKRAISHLKGGSDKLGELRTQVQQLTSERDTLKDRLEKGGSDPEIVAKFERTKRDLNGVTNDYRTLKEKYEKDMTEMTGKLNTVAVESEIRLALSGFEFDPALPPTVIETMKSVAVDKIKAMKSEFVEDGKGGKTLAFLDDTGAMKRDPAKGLAPVTVSDLLKNELSDVLKKQQTGAGAGSTPPSKEGSGAGIVDISSARTQVEADEMIVKTLMGEGLVKGTPEFSEKQMQMRTEAGVENLPLR